MVPPYKSLWLLAKGLMGFLPLPATSGSGSFFVLFPQVFAEIHSTMNIQLFQKLNIVNPLKICYNGLMKRSELIFNVLSVPVDFLMILLAVSTAYFLRYRVESIPILFDLSYHQYLKLAVVPIPFLLLLFALVGLYTQKGTRSLWREIGKVATAVSAGLMIVVVLFFFNRNLFPSRLIVLMGWILIITAVSVARTALLLIQRRLLAHGLGLHKLLVIEGEKSPQLVQEIEADSRLGYEITGRFGYSVDLPQKIEKLHREHRLDELMQADPNLTNEQILTLVDVCEDLGIKFIYLPTILESHRANVETDVVGSVPVIRLRTTPLEGWGRVVKRIMDIVVSLVGLVLFSPFFLLISLAIKLNSRGPIFFHQVRGSSFHNFQFYKFRSMHFGLSEGTREGDRIREELERQNVRRGPYVKIKNDPRVTKVGRFLRRTKFDELPQLWHILRGQMSLVGPRIHMMKEVAKFENQYKRIFTIKPGATGLAQINQLYNPELSFEEEIKLDLFYIENWSIWLDIYIILKTLVSLLTRRPNENY
jgi:exopolysaccharide biosynthesis polyprenyl glycosylphosphotransferase